MRSMNLVESILQSALDSQLANGCPGIILLVVFQTCGFKAQLKVT
ncbi:hypothetical protein [Oscillatoria sp. FACHB-1407]|nr:hypothetical protein [Oscillatoria sp. FACHB-1407]